jgi:putative oxidoreductase
VENTLNRYGPLAGRLLIAFIFIFAGYGKLTGFEGTVGYIASKGMPFPELAAVAAIVIELGGGLMLAAGWKARWAAGALVVFTAMTAFIFHTFWAAAPDQAQNQMIHFMKNLSIIGGLLYVVVHGSGPLSVSRREAAAGLKAAH